jgi:hypothetical protein
MHLFAALLHLFIVLKQVFMAITHLLLRHQELLIVLNAVSDLQMLRIVVLSPLIF